MGKRELTVKEALVEFADPRLWECLRNTAGSKECPASLDSAWELLIRSSPDVHFFQYMRDQIDQNDLSIHNVLLGKLFRITRKMIDGLEHQLQIGRLVANGVNNSGMRVPIDPALWTELRIFVGRETAEGGVWAFSHIRITALPAPAVTETACEHWLRKQQKDNRAVTKKGSLLKDARNALGNHLTNQIFDRAYANVFGRGRGRPRKVIQ